MNTVVEIIITLSFVFLIYSLLTTILVEIISAIFRLRARNLRLSIRRLLQDENHIEQENKSRWQKFIAFFESKKTERKFVQQFYEQPTIKQLSKSALYRSPSYIDPKDFSKTLYNILTTEPGFNDLDKIENALDYDENFDQKMSFSLSEWEDFTSKLSDNSIKKDEYIDSWLEKFKDEKTESRVVFSELQLAKLELDLKRSLNDKTKVKLVTSWKTDIENKPEIEPETSYKLKSLYKEANGDTDKFIELIENWFNNTMDRAKGWYKQKISKITFFVGFVVAIGFNVDTIYIAKELKQNTPLRESMIAKIEANTAADSTIQTYIDSLQTMQLNINESLSLSEYKNFKVDTKDPLRGNRFWAWFFSILGLVLTGIAISFGAPFWFDLMNKFMKLRTSGTPEVNKKKDVEAKESTTSLISGHNRKG